MLLCDTNVARTTSVRKKGINYLILIYEIDPTGEEVMLNAIFSLKTKLMESS